MKPKQKLRLRVLVEVASAVSVVLVVLRALAGLGGIGDAAAAAADALSGAQTGQTGQTGMTGMTGTQGVGFTGGGPFGTGVAGGGPFGSFATGTQGGNLGIGDLGGQPAGLQEISVPMASAALLAPASGRARAPVLAGAAISVPLARWDRLAPPALLVIFPPARKALLGFTGNVGTTAGPGMTGGPGTVGGAETGWGTFGIGDPTGRGDLGEPTGLPANANPTVGNLSALAGAPTAAEAVAAGTMLLLA